MNVNRAVVAWTLGWLLVVGGAGAALAQTTLSLQSPDFDEGATVPTAATCDGAGESPALMIRGVPSAARSLVITVRDPDAPGGVFTHWGLYNLAPATSLLAAGAAGHDLPGPAASIDNDYGASGYGAICPPQGQTHRYRFRLYALDRRLSSAPTDMTALKHAMQDHVIDQTSLTARYARP